MARTKGSGFKMKRTPVKGVLGDFFSNIFSKEKIEGRQEKQREKYKGTEYEGMTHFEKMQAKRKEARIPEWKRKHDAKKVKKVEKVEKDDPIIVGEPKFITNPKIKTDPWLYKDMGDGTYVTKKGEEGEEYTVKEGDKGWEAISSVFKKNSPYKKGVGKYAKQAKGSRGYKMKRK